MKHLCLLLALSALPVLVGCPEGSGTLDDDDATEEEEPEWQPLPAAIAEAFADEADDLGAPAAAVAILHGGVLYAGAVGTKVPDGDVPAEPTTLFRIGSVTKQLTSTALLQQVDDGLLSVDDAVTEHIDGLDLEGAGDFDDVTLHNLLSHSSGIYDLTPLVGGEDDDRLLEFTQSGFGFPDQAFLMNPPGEFWNYANPNFSLAGLVVELTDGRYYRDVMAAEVFEPMGMDRTYFLADEVLGDGDFAVGQTFDWTGETTEPRLAEPDSYDDAWSRPAGFAWSSVLDLARWGDFIVHGDEAMLSAASHAELVGSQVPTFAFLDYLDYAYGVMLWEETNAGPDWFELSTREHGGAIPGFAAEVITVPEHDLVIATLASTDGAYFRQLKGVVWTELLGVEPVAFPDLDIDPDDFERFVGVYDDAAQYGLMEVSQDGGGNLDVAVALFDQYDVPYSPDLVPTSRDNFTFTVQGYPFSLTFISEAPEEPARWFRTRYFVGERTDEAVGDRAAPADRAAVDRLLAQLRAPTLR